MKQYSYPDKNDRVTSSFIGMHEGKQGYWKRSEDYIIRLIKRHIKKYISKENRILMDAGCGIGRLFPVFEDLFSKIIAIEPDYRRYIDSQKTAAQFNLSNKVELINDTINNASIEENIDVIICSHVLQHISEKDVEKAIGKFNKIIADDGMLFILTSFSTNKDDYYTRQYMKECMFVREEIAKEEFERIVLEGNDILPVHFFTKDSITKILERHNLETIDFRKYHKVGDSKKYIDMLIAATKKEIKKSKFE